MIGQIQAKEAALGDSASEHIVKFKLGNGILPAETSLCAIVKGSIKLSREEIMRDASKFDFILVNEQVKNSLEGIDDEILKENLSALLEANDELSLRYKEELSERYRYVELNRRDWQLKKLVDTVIRTARGTPSKAPKEDQICYLGIEDLDIVEQILKSHIKISEKGLSKCPDEYVED